MKLVNVTRQNLAETDRCRLKHWGHTFHNGLF